MTLQPEPQDLGGKVDRLEASTRRLTAEIDRLGNTLARVRRLEDAQVEMREQTTLAMVNALAAADQVQETSHRVTTLSTASLQRDRRRAFATKAIVIGMLILLPIVAALVYGAVLTRVDGLVDSQRADLLRGCNIRNQMVSLTVRREQQLAQADDPSTRAFHSASAEAYSKLAVDCTAIYGSRVDVSP